MKLWLGALMLFMPTLALGVDVTLAWDASVTPEVSGYKIYVGNSSRTYTRIDDAGGVLTYTVTGLDAGKTYFFAATAYVPPDNTTYDPKESDFSNEVNETFISCDVNADGSINVLDLQRMSLMIMGSVPIDLWFDLNQDGSINVLDLQILSNVILGNRTCP